LEAVMVNLGDRVKDKINGFVGIVIGSASYLYGCEQILVAPEVLGEHGKRPDAEWIDEDRVEVVHRAVHSSPSTAPARAGGPLTSAAPPVRR
jgi:hypothetical protein